ncbi:hypothetical protein [Serinibacter arcticus]|uniref:hypothetical protein n=1 Tax=Serinibacter arcticus TaxID=1655435 RepID=UPI0013047FB8|nr:hypothetical protein [Serinibacter arcticus]
MPTNDAPGWSLYSPGEDFALVTGATLALLDAGVPADVVTRVWDAARQDGGLAQVVAPLVGSLADLPTFAVVVVDGGQARALVRGDLEVVVGEHRISGQGVATWREETLPSTPEDGAIEVVLARIGAGDAAGEHGHALPVLAGVVRASHVTSTLELRPTAKESATPAQESGSGTDEESGDSDPDPAAVVPGTFPHGEDQAVDEGAEDADAQDQVDAPGTDAPGTDAVVIGDVEHLDDEHADDEAVAAVEEPVAAEEPFAVEAPSTDTPDENEHDDPAATDEESGPDEVLEAPAPWAAPGDGDEVAVEHEAKHEAEGDGEPIAALEEPSVVTGDWSAPVEHEEVASEEVVAEPAEPEPTEPEPTEPEPGETEPLVAEQVPPPAVEDGTEAFGEPPLDVTLHPSTDGPGGYGFVSQGRTSVVPAMPSAPAVPPESSEPSAPTAAEPDGAGWGHPGASPVAPPSRSCRRTPTATTTAARSSTTRWPGCGTPAS